MYKATSRAEVAEGGPLENQNLGSLMSVLMDLHSKSIVESQLLGAAAAREAGVEVIAAYPLKVRNRDSLLDSTHRVLSDFGPYAAYERGRTHSRSAYDFVGSRSATDRRFALPMPAHEFSLGGRCPNMADGFKERDGRPSGHCWTYDAAYGELQGEHLQGGLCPNGAGDGSVVPTGQAGCVYSYGQPVVVNLDDFTGITSQDCGGRLCRDYADFRQRCTNRAFKFRFSPHGGLEEVDHCIEYDIHPSCATSCDEPRCQALLAHVADGEIAEVGLPFWHGRCRTGDNRRRAELLAKAFGVQGAKDSHRVVDSSQGATCNCAPGTDGMSTGLGYCDRSFSGVCTECRIPGTQAAPSEEGARSEVPFCSLGVLRQPEYADELQAPRCASRRPSHLCCLYTGGCEGTADPVDAALDDDGFELVRASGSTEDVAVLLVRAAYERGFWPLPGASLDSAMAGTLEFWQAAYEEWGMQPGDGTLQEALARMRGVRPAAEGAEYFELHEIRDGPLGRSSPRGTQDLP